ncbi:MAG: hypothetical protein AB8H12_15475 [Lewinella sp.]
MDPLIKKIIKLADVKIKKHGWKVYPNDIKYYNNFVRLFYQSKGLVDSEITSMDDDDMIYGIGIFLVDLRTLEFHNVSCIEEIAATAAMLNANYS